MEAEDAEEAELDPLRVRLRPVGSDLGNRQGKLGAEVGMDVDREDGDFTWSTGAPDSGSGPNPAALPFPDSLSLPAQLPSPRDPSGMHPDWESSVCNKCDPLHAPVADRTRYEKMK